MARKSRTLAEELNNFGTKGDPEMILVVELLLIICLDIDPEDVALYGNGYGDSDSESDDGIYEARAHYEPVQYVHPQCQILCR
jgi:hypothetical protein